MVVWYCVDVSAHTIFGLDTNGDCQANGAEHCESDAGIFDTHAANDKEARIQSKGDGDESQTSEDGRYLDRLPLTTLMHVPTFRTPIEQ